VGMIGYAELIAAIDIIAAIAKKISFNSFIILILLESSTSFYSHSSPHMGPCMRHTLKKECQTGPESRMLFTDTSAGNPDGTFM
jgi:hypothetical protein